MRLVCLSYIHQHNVVLAQRWMWTWQEDLHTLPRRVEIGIDTSFTLLQISKPSLPGIDNDYDKDRNRNTTSKPRWQTDDKRCSPVKWWPCRRLEITKVAVETGIRLLAPFTILVKATTFIATAPQEQTFNKIRVYLTVFVLAIASWINSKIIVIII